MSTAPPAIPGLERPEVLGRGGYGTVYAVDEPEFGRRVALKVLEDRLDGDDVRRAFARECQAMGALSGHPHIVSVHRGGTTGRGEPFIVMDLLSGGSLGDRLRGEGPLPWADVVEVGVVLAGALETAHRAGILHLDVKPANVLVSRFGDAVLSDFGISRMPGVTSTLDGRVRASAAYTAPERLLGGGATVAVDLYGLGATLFALLSGRPAFVGDAGEDLVTTVARVVREPLPDLRRRGVPGPVAAIVERLMAKEPDARFATAAEAATALQSVQRTLGRPVTRAVIEGTAPLHGGSATLPAVPAPPPTPPPPTPLPPRWPPLSPHQSAPTVVGVPLTPVTAPAPALRPVPRRRRGPLVAGMAAALIVGFGVTGGVLLLSRPAATLPTPAPTSSVPVTSAAPSVALAGGVTDPAAAAVQKVLAAYVSGIDDRRYTDAFALFSPDSQSAEGGLPAWQQGLSTTRITGARIVDVRSAGTGDATAEMTFTSTQDAQYGPNGQTCTHWDLVYTLAGPGPGYLIRSAKPATPPQAC